MKVTEALGEQIVYEGTSGYVILNKKVFRRDLNESIAMI